MRSRPVRRDPRLRMNDDAAVSARDVPRGSPRRRVLSLVPDAFGGYGGIAVYNRDFQRAIASHPDVAEVVLLPRLMKYAPEALPPGITHVTSGLGGKGRYLRALIATIRTRGAFDAVVCAHVNLLPLAWLAHLITRAPIVLLIYGIEAWQRSPSVLSRWALRFVAAYISISEVTKQRFIDWANPHAPGYVLPNAIHLDNYAPGARDPALEHRYGARGKRVIMTFGRLVGAERCKGFDEILEILPQLLRDVPNLLYVIVGEGSDRPRLERKAASLGVSEHVVFTGFVAEEEKAALYRLADAYLMPSRGEGFGFVVLEAMATGVPTVGSKVDGTREALRDGLLGALVDPDDPAQIHRAVVRALAQPKVVPAGLDYFSYANFERRLHAIMDECLCDPRGGHLASRGR